MLQEKLKNKNLILASGSPRRHQYFKDLGFNFNVRIKEVEEIYPDDLTASEIPTFLAKLKAQPFKELEKADILITSDTIVWHKNKALGKPKNLNDAIAMLQSMSGDWHEVISAICITTKTAQHTATSTTRVKFKALTTAEIEYYVNTYKPLDKAGAYGIQEWIGLIGIEEIQGSYPNVVGLPTNLLYTQLLKVV